MVRERKAAHNLPIRSLHKQFAEWRLGDIAKRPTLLRGTKDRKFW